MLFDALRTFLRQEDGPTAVEYAVLLALIVVAILGSINAVGNKTLGLWTHNLDVISQGMDAN